MLYTIVLALHILSAIAVFASLALDWLATAGPRRAKRAHDARPWVWALQVKKRSRHWPIKSWSLSITSYGQKNRIPTWELITLTNKIGEGLSVITSIASNSSATP